MAIKVGITGVTTKHVAVTGSTTQVKKVIVGTPVRRVTSGEFSINNLNGVNAVGATHGDLLIYNDVTQKWEASKDLEEQNINGGSY